MGVFIGFVLCLSVASSCRSSNEAQFLSPLCSQMRENCSQRTSSGTTDGTFAPSLPSVSQPESEKVDSYTREKNDTRRRNCKKERRVTARVDTDATREVRESRGFWGLKTTGKLGRRYCDR